jgi:hypothetical protein
MKRKSKFEHQRALVKVLCRLAILRDDALRCELPDCRRARTCMGKHFNCVFKPHDPLLRMHPRDVSAWNALAVQRQDLRDRLRCR